MLQGLAAAGVVTNVAQQNLQPRWSTRMSQCDEPAKCEDCAFSFLCMPCATAVAKTEADKSNVCYNFACWHPIASYSYIRHIYGLPGSCGDDCGYGIFCMPCSVRHMYTESRIRQVPPMYMAAGTNREEWHVSLFDCDCCQFFNALLCAPCVAGQIRGQLQPSSGGDCCFNTFCIIPTAVYGQTRHEFGLITDCGPLEDLCIPLFCFPCSLTRAQNEIRWQTTSGAQRIANAVVGPVGGMAVGAMGGGVQQQPYGHQGQQYQQQQQQKTRGGYC